MAPPNVAKPIPPAILDSNLILNPIPDPNSGQQEQIKRDLLLPYFLPLPYPLSLPHLDHLLRSLDLHPRGWRWSKHVKPIAKTEWCEAPHFQYRVSGQLHIVMANGKEFDTGPGDVTSLPSGHDAWVIGPDPVVLVDWYGAINYAKK